MRPWPIRPHISIAGLAVGLLLLTSSPLQARRAVNTCPENSGNLVVTAPVLKYTISNFDPNWFSTSNSNQSTPLFTLQIVNIPANNIPSNLTLWVQITADTSLNGTGAVLSVFDQVIPLTAADIGTPLTSAQVFALPVQPDNNAIAFDKSDLYNLVVNQHQVPQMSLSLKFALLCETGGIAASMTDNITFTNNVNQFQDALLQVNNIQALTPGTNISNPVPVVISTQYPIFQVSSPLIDTMAFTAPTGESNVTISIYEVPSGSNPQEVFDGQEFAEFPVSQNQVSYPPGLSQLVPGNVYAWRARGLLRGPESDYIYSNALYFQIDPRLAGGVSATDPGSVLTPLQTLEGQVKAGDDYGKRVLAALKIILGENYEMLNLSQTKMTPAQGAIRLNGRPLALEDLERLAREFQQSSNSVTRLRFQ